MNDGVGPSTSEGTGLAGLAERARELTGTVVTEHADGCFRLVVTAPFDAEAGESS